MNWSGSSGNTQVTWFWQSGSEKKSLVTLKQIGSIAFFWKKDEKVYSFFEITVWFTDFSYAGFIQLLKIGIKKRNRFCYRRFCKKLLDHCN